VRVALVTIDAARGLDEDLPPLTAALARRGVEVTAPSWDDAGVDWGALDAAVVRSTWDYTTRREAYLAWARDAADRTLLLNPPAHLAWSSEKRYLAELAAAGVPVVPTWFADPGETPFVPEGDVVVKPSVGAGSMDAARHPLRDGALAHVAALHAAGRTAMVQPYLPRVEDDGETGLVYIDGRLSHGFRKGAMLTGDAPEVGGLYLREDITPRQPSADEIAVAEAALAAAPGGWLYARVDLVPGSDGRPVVLELELVEPSLFVACGPASADALAEAVIARIASARRAATGDGAPSSS
jgi:glutathione synthase/RimK-type ligase-like ATP-grasp enzyme